jgi:hypothetical protein
MHVADLARVAETDRMHVADLTHVMATDRKHVADLTRVAETDRMLVAVEMTSLNVTATDGQIRVVQAPLIGREFDTGR